MRERVRKERVDKEMVAVATRLWRFQSRPLRRTNFVNESDIRIGLAFCAWIDVPMSDLAGLDTR